MWEHTGGWGMGWVGLGIVHVLLFWAVVIFAVLALIRLLSGTKAKHGDDSGQRRPLDILRERYARGQIDQAEYQRMRRELDE